LLSWASREPQALTWAIGFLDEVWWSRFALPPASAWQDPEEPLRLIEQRWQKADPDAKALACYGVLWHHGPADAPVRDQMSLRFVDGRPVSDITTQFLASCCTELESQGKTAWLLIWDNASWHYSKTVRSWIRDHNQQVKLTAKGCASSRCFCPSRVLGSTPSNPNGCMASALWSNPTDCSPPSSWLSAFVPTITVRMKHICPSRRMSLENALEQQSAFAL
jgi:hypothetical protein